MKWLIHSQTSELQPLKFVAEIELALLIAQILYSHLQTENWGYIYDNEYDPLTVTCHIKTECVMQSRLYIS